MWLYHLQQSPYCHAHYAVVCDNKGRDVCMCGWVGPKPTPPAPKGMTFGEMWAQRQEHDDISDS